MLDGLGEGIFTPVLPPYYRTGVVAVNGRWGTAYHGVGQFV